MMSAILNRLKLIISEISRTFFKGLSVKNVFSIKALNVNRKKKYQRHD